MQTVLITGGSRGIGAAAVRLFANQGYQTAFCYYSGHHAAQAVARQTGAQLYQADIADPAQCAALVQQAQADLGHIDVLINNAGVALQKLATDTTDEEYRRIMGVHIDGTFYMCRAVLPEMVRRKSGRIINVSSMWGQIGGSCETVYSAAKAAVIGLTKALAKEVAPSGITVNCVAPGVIATDMTTSLGDDTLNALREDTPLLRLGTPEDIAQSMLFLASPAADFITGQILAPNGGMVI